MGGATVVVVGAAGAGEDVEAWNDEPLELVADGEAERWSWTQVSGTEARNRERSECDERANVRDERQVTA